MFRVWRNSEKIHGGIFFDLWGRTYSYSDITTVGLTLHKGSFRHYPKREYRCAFTKGMTGRPRFLWQYRGHVAHPDGRCPSTTIRPIKVGEASALTTQEALGPGMIKDPVGGILGMFVWPGDFTVKVILTWWKVDNYFLDFSLFEFLCLLKLQFSWFRGQYTAPSRRIIGDVAATCHSDSRRRLTITLQSESFTS